MLSQDQWVQREGIEAGEIQSRRLLAEEEGFSDEEQFEEQVCLPLSSILLPSPLYPLYFYLYLLFLPLLVSHLSYLSYSSISSTLQLFHLFYSFISFSLLSLYLFNFYCSTLQSLHLFYLLSFMIYHNFFTSRYIQQKKQ